MAQEASGIELDENQRREAVAFLSRLVDDVAAGYLAPGLWLAHREKKVAKETFWSTLTARGERKDKRCERNEKFAIVWAPEGSPCPEDPYEKLDFQGCVKYLLHGRKKVLDVDGKDVLASDSYAFFEYFSIPCKRPPAGSGAVGTIGTRYEKDLKAGIVIRNISKHAELLDKLTRTDLDKDIKTLYRLTEPLKRKAEVARSSDPEIQAALEKLKRQRTEIWEDLRRKYKSQFDSEPTDLWEMVAALLLPEGKADDETELLDSPAVKAAVEDYLTEYNLSVQGGMIYSSLDRGKLKENLRKTFVEKGLLKLPPPPAMPQGPKPAGRDTVRPLSANVVKALGGLSRIVKAADAPDALGTFLSGDFLVTADESVFLCDEGRMLLAAGLRTELGKRKKKLRLDESVISGLFHRFRESAPDPKEEPEELDPDERDRHREEWDKGHQEAKKAVKVLRRLRESGCLQVVRSPIDGAPSYENIRAAAVQNPRLRMLVLSQDATLADELQVKARNAVVLKVNKDGSLLRCFQSDGALRSILENKPPREGDGVQPAASEAETEPLAREKEGDLAAGTMIAEDVNGSRRELRLGGLLGRGGEGAVYQVDARTVAKVYHEKRRTEAQKEKLRDMLRNDPHISSLCWPTELLYTREGDWVGFLMPRVKGIPLTVIYHPGRNYHKLVELKWSRKSLVKIGENIARSFKEMHAKKIRMGDVNPGNFVVDPDRLEVQLVDCDSYQFGSYLCPVGTPLFTPPEMHVRMRAEGRENYGFFRTEEHERYTLAILLFEILMLGKAPYEARDTDADGVVEAIIAGRFPYRFAKAGEERSGEDQGKVPVGQTQQIWSHTTYQIKESFYNTFTGGEKNRLSAAQWEQAMREYYRQITMGRSTDELAPNSFKVVTLSEGEEGEVTMIDLECEKCGAKFNMDAGSYKQRLARHDPILCPKHWAQRDNLRHRLHTVQCDICHQSYETTCLDWIERSKKQLQMICPACSVVQVKCSHCGKTYQEQRERAEWAKREGKELLCPECFELLFLKTECERCGKKFTIRRDILERHKKFNDKILCKECRGGNEG